MTDQLALSLAQPSYIELAADIVAAYVAKNSVRPADLPDLIASVHGALKNVGNPAPAQAPEKAVPHIPIKKTITPDFIISLEDGRQYRSMKRHLTTRGLTPEQYREKWGLPRDYPMVAPNYAAQRSELAKTMGLGQKRRKSAAKAGATAEKVSAPAKKRGGRKKAP